MKRKIALLLAVTMLTGCGGTAAEVSVENASVTENVETEADIYVEDAQQLIYAVKAAHPAFIIEGMLPESYEEAEAKFLDASRSVNSLDDFEVAVNVYLNSFNDMHTSVIELATKEEESTLMNMLRYRPDIKYTEQDGKMLLTDDEYIPVGGEVLSVGGIDTETIFKTVDEMFPIENHAAESFYRRNYSLSREILRLSGCDVSGDTVEVMCSDGARQVSFRDVYDTSSMPEEETKTADIRMINDILYVNINTFSEKDEDYVKALEQVRAFADNGGGKVIVDVRNNSGGKMDFLKDMIRAFNMNVPTGRYICRHSRDEWESVKNDLKAAVDDKTFSDNPGSLGLARANPDVDMAVLCNANSLSASVVMCAGIQDGKLGKIIGVTPRNSPSFFMDTVRYVLPNTGIVVGISSGYVFRADENADQKVMTPDIVLDLNYSRGDAMIKYAVEEYFGEAYS